MTNNYFRVGDEYFFFNDRDYGSTAKAWVESHIPIGRRCVFKAFLLPGPWNPKEGTPVDVIGNLAVGPEPPDHAPFFVRDVWRERRDDMRGVWDQVAP